MKKTTTFLGAVSLCFSLGVAANPAKDISGKEKLICKVVLCVPIGLVVPASHKKCVQAVLDWSIYLATLSVFKKPPKCPILNAKGERVGKAKKAKQVCKYSPNPDQCNKAIDSEEFDMSSPAVCELLPTKTAKQRQEKQECIDNIQSRGAG